MADGESLTFDVTSEAAPKTGDVTPNVATQTTTPAPDATVTTPGAVEVRAVTEPHKEDDHPAVAELRRQLEAAQRERDEAKLARERIESDSRRRDEHLVAEREGRQRAESQAGQYYSEAQRATAAQFESHLSEIQSALASKDRERLTILAQIKAAKEAADYDTETLLVEALTDVKVAIFQLRDGEHAVKSKAERWWRGEQAKVEAAKQEAEKPKTEPQQPQRQLTKAEEFNAFVETLTPRAQRWLMDHEDAFLDPFRRQELSISHQKAIRSGHPEGSDDYYTAIENYMGYTKPDAETPRNSAATPPAQRSAPMPAAPVSRDSGNGYNSSGTQRITLSPAEVQMADELGMSREQYAKNKALISRQQAIS